jgi:hypothetical protein
MINYIQHLWQSLIKKFVKQTDPKVQTKDSERIDINSGFLSFTLNKEDGILIHCLLPKIDFDNTDIDQIAIEAERFAEMLLCINDGLLKKEIINVLKGQYNNETNPSQKLLIENVLNFWSILYTHYKAEKKKSIKQLSKMPLIRPMAVFSTKR